MGRRTSAHPRGTSARQVRTTCCPPSLCKQALRPRIKLLSMHHCWTKRLEIQSEINSSVPCASGKTVDITLKQLCETFHPHDMVLNIIWVLSSHHNPGYLGSNSVSIKFTQYYFSSPEIIGSYPKSLFNPSRRNTM